MPQTRVWFFSDLHLELSPFYQAWLKLLREEVRPGDRVVLNGDIFDLFVGDSSVFTQKFAEFFDLLSLFSQRGVSCDYVYGNHDFHLRGVLSKWDVTIHEDGFALEVDSPERRKKIWVEHGDLVDQDDKNYLRMRALFRSAPVRIGARLLPGGWIQGIGKLLSRKADQQVSELPEAWPEAQRERLREKFRSFAQEKKRQGFDFVVLGHCHDLDEVEPYYFNMGYPPVHRQYLRYDSGLGGIQRLKFPGIPAEN